MTESDTGSGGWRDVTEERARGTERRYRRDVTPDFRVELTVAKSSRDEDCPYQLVLSTVYEEETRHVSDHPVAGYADPDAARDALHALKAVVDDVIEERGADDLPDPDRRLAHDVVPRFLDEYVDQEAGVCQALYDTSLHG